IIQPVDIYESTVFVTAVCDRLLILHNVVVNAAPPETPVIVSSNLFYLQHLIWTCIEFIMKSVGAEKTITISFEKLAKILW
ncbi:MAG: hypothetical protein P8Y30_07625, partial [candidate division WOR-3 bacterium]